MTAAKLLDPARLDALQAIGLLDRPPEPSLDRLTRLASRMLHAPVALVSLVESHRQFFASSIGLNEPWVSMRETPLTHSFCQHVVASGAPLIIDDAPGHPLVCENLAIPDLGVVAYLGVPLRTRDGHVLGSFCVADGVSRGWTSDDLTALTDLAQSVMSELELRELSTVLKSTTDSYRGLLDMTNELVCAADATGRITHVNRAWCKAFGYTLREARELYVSNMIVPEDLGRFQGVVASLVEGAFIEQFEVTAFSRTGERVICRGNATRMLVEDPDHPTGVRFAGSHSVYRDVSAERRAHAERARLVNALEGTPDFVGIASAGGQIEFLNRAGRALLGLSDGTDLATLTADDFHTPATLQLLATEAFPTASTRGWWSGLGEVRAQDGEVIPVSMTISSHPGIIPGEPAYFSAIMRDVREQEAANASLRESQARFANERAFLSATLESLSDGVVACDPEGNLVLFNSATREFHGLPESPLPASEWSKHYALYGADGVTPLHVDEIPLMRAFRGEDVQDAAMVIAPVGAQPRTVFASGKQIRADDGTVLGAVVAMRDVTARVKAEQALRDSEARFRSALEGGQFAYAALKLVRDDAGTPVNFEYTDVNAACEDIWALPAEELVGSRFTDVWPTAEERGLLDAFLVVHATGIPRLLECDAPEPSFEAQWLAMHVVPTDDGVSMLARDISSAKRAERELRLLADVTHRLSNAKDLDSATEAALEVMASAIAWDYAESWVKPAADGWELTPGGETDSLQLGTTWRREDDYRLQRFASSAARTRLRRGEGLVGSVWESEGPLFYPALDAPGVNFTRLRAAMAAGLRAGFAVPVVADGEVIAVLAFFTRDWKRVQEADVRLLAAVSAQVGSVLRRKMAEDMLSRERRFLSTVLDSLSENVSVCAPDGRLVLFNRATTEMHGAADADLSADEWSARYGVFLPDGETPYPAQELPHMRVLSTGADALGIEYIVRAPGRTPRTLVANAHILRGENQQVMGSVCAARDMTAERDAERAHRESEQRLSLIYDNVSDLLSLAAVERDGDGAVVDFRFESVNARLLAATGRAPGHYLGRTLRELARPDRVEELQSRYLAAVDTGAVQQFEYESIIENGRLQLESTLTPVRDSAGAVSHVLAASRDVTARRIAEAGLRESELGFRTMLETVRALAVIVDIAGNVTFVNDAVLAVTGWTRDAVVGQDWFGRFHADAGSSRRLFEDMISGADYIPHAESEILTRTGARRLVVWDNTVLRNAAGVVTGTASIGQDVTNQRSMEAQLARLAEHDELTGLLNRRGFTQQVEYGIRAARRHRRNDMLLYIDLDRFKPINDTYGHAEGDKALRAVAEVLQSTIRETDVAGRLGGDEFAVYAAGTPDGTEVSSLAERLVTALAAHNAKATDMGRPYEIGFSIGVAEVSPDDTRDELLARADSALYRIKHAR